MSDDTAEIVAPALRREALLPNERNRGLGTVAVVCTMAGVASGLALATTLMAMQVADTMSARTCSYHAAEVAPVAAHSDQGFLGLTYTFDHGAANVRQVLPGTPAQASGIRPGDRVLAVNGDRLDSLSELQESILRAPPGSRPVLTIERDGKTTTVRPTLISWPVVSY